MFWIELSKPIVSTLLCLLAVLMVSFLVVLVRMGVSFSDFSFLINIGIFVCLTVGIIVLFVGGLFFFKFSLALATNSKECWRVSLQGEMYLSKLDKAFYIACRHICVHIGSVLTIENPDIPLIYYGQAVIKPTIDILLTFR